MRNGTTAFESPLTAIAGAQVEALAEGKVPYVLLKGRQLDEVRLGFTPTLVRNLIVVAGLFVSAPAAMAVIHNYTYASDGALLWGAVIAFLFTFILAEKTLQPGDGPAFVERLIGLEPRIATFNADDLEPPIGCLGIMMVSGFLVAAISLALMLPTLLLLMVTWLAIDPDRPLNGYDEGPETWQIWFNSVLAIVYFVGLWIFLVRRSAIDSRSGRVQNDPADSGVLSSTSWLAWLQPLWLVAGLLVIYVVRRTLGI